MRIDIDVKTVSEAGYDKYLYRNTFNIAEGNAVVTSRYTEATNIVGGVLGSEGTIYVGSKQIKIDGRQRTITVEDGGINVSGGGGITVSDGGNIEIQDDGDLKMYDSSDNLVVFLGYE
jgi:hypothetical protein